MFSFHFSARRRIEVVRTVSPFTMGKRGKQDPLSLDKYSDKLYSLADANGYEPGRHRDEDGERKKFTYMKKSLTHHDSSLQRYLAWRFRQTKIENNRLRLAPPESADVERLWLRKGTSAPELVELKDFMRFWAKTAQPRIVEKPTVVSGESFAKNFFTGFQRATGTPIAEEDSEEVYYWIRNTLVDEGLVVNVTKEKYLFTRFDNSNVLRSFWCADDPIYIPERYRIQFQFIFLVYNWSGARIGAFFNGSLLYKHITLAVQRTPSGWRLIYQLDQHWVKGNRSPDHIAYGIAGSSHPVLMVDETTPFLALALADNAIRGVKTLDDLRQIRLRHGEEFRQLKFNREVEGLPILRKVKSGCVTEDPMPVHAFTQILDRTATTAGYTWPITVHAIRRALGKKIDERYTEVQRSQHLVQSDTRVFGRSYVGKVSSVNGRAAVPEEKADHSFVEYFQGLRRFWEPGFPCELPAAKLDVLENDVEMLAKKARKLSLEAEGASAHAKKQAENDLNRYRVSQRRKALEQYQVEWLDQSVDQRDSGKAGKTDVLDILSCLVPERARLAQWMASDKPLSEDESWQALEDMLSLLKWEEESPILYLPGHRPVDRRCPVESCQTELDCLPKGDRNSHVHNCKSRALAEQSLCLQKHVRYCYHCYTWCVGDEIWLEHCRRHLATLSSTLCGTVTYRHTLLRPAVCPWSMNNGASEELKTYTRDEKWWAHVDEHLVQCHWPCPCPHPLCADIFASSDSLRYHFIDQHGASRGGSPGKRKATTSKPADPTRREHDTQPGSLQWLPDGSLESLTAAEEQALNRSRKRPRQLDQTICPALLLALESDSDDEMACQDIGTDNPPRYRPSRSADNSFRASPPPSCSRDLQSDVSTLFSPAVHSLSPVSSNEVKHGTETPETILDFDTKVSQLEDDFLFSTYLRTPSPVADSNAAVHSREDSELHLVSSEAQSSSSVIKATQVRLRLKSPNTSPSFFQSPVKATSESSESYNTTKQKSTSGQCPKVRLRINPPRAPASIRLVSDGKRKRMGRGNEWEEETDGKRKRMGRENQKVGYGQRVGKRKEPSKGKRGKR